MNKQEFSSSAMFGVSVRAWIAVMLTGTVCLCTLGKVTIAIMKQDATLLEVTEPLYTLGGMAEAYYLGSSKTTKQSPTPPVQ
jgi:hypothetical protein